MWQSMLVFGLFALSLAYLGKGIFRLFLPHSTKKCAKGCASCPASALERTIQNTHNQ
jgi:uncharacterized protein YjeT (DUF2065 family)